MALLLQGASLHDLTADLIRQLGLTGHDTTESRQRTFAIEPISVPLRASEPQRGGRQDNECD